MANLPRPTRAEASHVPNAVLEHWFRCRLERLLVGFPLEDVASMRSVCEGAVAVIVFILITAPVAAHAIGRAGYFVGIPVWEKTVKDELVNCYDAETHRLLSGLETEEELEAYKQNLDFKPRIRLTGNKGD